MLITDNPSVARLQTRGVLLTLPAAVQSRVCIVDTGGSVRFNVCTRIPAAFNP